jgi:hypothetical protein
MSSEQAPWVKVGVYVRRKASGFLHSRGEIVAVDGGLGVRCPTNHAVKRDDDIASSWIPCDSNLMNPKIGQAEWIKEGTDVRFLGGGQPGTIVKVPGGLAVRYGGDRALLWSGSIAGSWAPCEETPTAPASFTTKPGVLASDVMSAYHPATSFQATVGTKVVDFHHVHGQPSPLPMSTMEQILARLDAIDAALKPLTHLALDAEGRVIVPPTESTPTAKRYVQAHLARDEAATALGWMDSYMAPCSHCGAARWEGCTAVGDEPDYGEPVPRVNVRLWNAEGKAEFMSIPWWADPCELVARGLFEVSTALVPPVPGVLRPGLRPVARTWESLDDEERDYWHTLVNGYLDGTLVERTVGAVEWAVLGAMVRVFGLQRKA